MTVELHPDLVDFLESGVSLLVGARDASLRPACARAVGSRVSPDRRTITVYLNRAVSERLLACFADNGQIAVTFGRPADHRAVQIKGRVVEQRPCNEDDSRQQERYLGSFIEQIHVIGLPRALARRVRLHPGVAVTFEPLELFDQTPGPGAGRPIEGAGRP